METNLNCDLGEKSIHHSGENDVQLMKVINTANIACGFHAGDEDTMLKSIELSKIHNINIGVHPGFADKKNFGRKRIYLDKKEVKKLILDQILILSKIAENKGIKLTHVKPHGALNNMACEDFELSLTIGEVIKEFNIDLIYLILPLTEMERAAKKLNMKYACEIFADRNYEDNGSLISRNKDNALVSDPLKASINILKMLQDKSIYCYSGKRLPCEIDSICVHGDGINAVEIVTQLKNYLKHEGLIFKPLNLLNKYK